MRTVDNAAEYYRVILDAVPLPVFVVDDDVRFLDYNQSAAKLIQADRADVLQKRGGEVLHCLNARKSLAGCGHARQCSNCVIRNSVGCAIAGTEVKQRKTFMELQTPDGIAAVDMLVTATPMELDGQRRVLLILEDITELLALREILPICSGCKSIRDDKQYWEKLESYLHKHLNLDFSHGLCPKCTRNISPNTRENWRGAGIQPPPSHLRPVELGFRGRHRRDPAQPLQYTGFHGNLRLKSFYPPGG